MLLDSWSIALSLCAVVALFLMGTAGRTAVRVLRYWDPGSDSNRQIRLEGEIWLSSTLVAYALACQIVSLVLFLFAADRFSGAIAGAMCATGALLANPYGMSALGVKLTGLFFYGYWIVIHRLDTSTPSYPLVRVKYLYFFFLLPLLLADVSLQTLYLRGLTPDIITSCCGVVFEAGGSEGNFFASLDPATVTTFFYGTAGVLLTVSVLLLLRWQRAVSIVLGGIWFWFLGVALVAVTLVFSSYIYAMPYHHCPFCILKPEYRFIGFVLYGTLLPAVFYGMLPVGLAPFAENPEIAGEVRRWLRKSLWASLILLILFTTLASVHMLLYHIAGGEW